MAHMMAKLWPLVLREFHVNTSATCSKEPDAMESLSSNGDVTGVDFPIGST